jgi:hypothetical protein
VRLVTQIVFIRIEPHYLVLSGPVWCGLCWCCVRRVGPRGRTFAAPPRAANIANFEAFYTKEHNRITTQGRWQLQVNVLHYSFTGVEPGGRPCIAFSAPAKVQSSDPHSTRQTQPTDLQASNQTGCTMTKFPLSRPSCRSLRQA